MAALLGFLPFRACNALSFQLLQRCAECIVLRCSALGPYRVRTVWGHRPWDDGNLLKAASERCAPSFPSPPQHARSTSCRGTSYVSRKKKKKRITDHANPEGNGPQHSTVTELFVQVRTLAQRSTKWCLGGTSRGGDKVRSGTENLKLPRPKASRKTLTRHVPALSPTLQSSSLPLCHAQDGSLSCMGC